MANIAIFKSGKTPQYIQSVHTGDYENDPDVIINPDISAVSNVSIKYWKRNGNSIGEMTQAEKDAIAANELTIRKSVADSLATDMKISLTALVKVINSRFITNKITVEELVTALKNEIN